MDNMFLCNTLHFGNRFPSHRMTEGKVEPPRQGYYSYYQGEMETVEDAINALDHGILAANDIIKNNYVGNNLETLLAVAVDVEAFVDDFDGARSVYQRIERELDVVARAAMDITEPKFPSRSLGMVSRSLNNVIGLFEKLKEIFGQQPSYPDTSAARQQPQ